MSTTSSLFSLPLLPSRINDPRNSTSRRMGFGRQRVRRPHRGNKVACALHRDASFGHGRHDGKLVDEDMIVLRMRIHEMKMMEEGHAEVADYDWMEWEKKYYCEDYESDICEAVGLLQSQLMNTRPGVALAMLGLVSISVPISMGVVLLRLLDVAKVILVGAH